MHTSDSGLHAVRHIIWTSWWCQLFHTDAATWTLLELAGSLVSTACSNVLVLETTNKSSSAFSMARINHTSCSGVPWTLCILAGVHQAFHRIRAINSLSYSTKIAKHFSSLEQVSICVKWKEWPNKVIFFCALELLVDQQDTQHCCDAVTTHQRGSPSLSDAKWTVGHLEKLLDHLFVLSSSQANLNLLSYHLFQVSHGSIDSKTTVEAGNRIWSELICILTCLE